MKVLLVNGSPHKKGCTFTALSEIKEELAKNDVESEIFWIGTKPVRGCIACGSCRHNDFTGESAKCAFDDDVCNDLIDKFSECDGIIIGSPVYYAGPNGALLAILDRAFYSGSANLVGKPGAAIVSCRRGGASSSFDRLNKYFTITNMPVVSSQYWNSVHGQCPEDVLQDKEGLQIMRRLAHNMANLLKGKLYEDFEEEREITNFIQ